MQESTLTKNKIPGPNRKLMQQADGTLPLSPQLGPWKDQECLRVRQTASYARCGVST